MAEIRRHAADAARRVTEKQPELLRPYADHVLGALTQSTSDDWRMLAHRPGGSADCAYAFAAATRSWVAWPLLDDPSIVVRSTAIEGLALLASLVPALRREVEPILEEAIVAAHLACDRGRGQQWLVCGKPREREG